MATISANGDRNLGSLIAELMDKIGHEGTINVEDGNKLTHETEYVEGMKVDNGFLSPYFITNPKTMNCEFENAFVFVTDEKISRPQ